MENLVEPLGKSIYKWPVFHIELLVSRKALGFMMFPLESFMMIMTHENKALELLQLLAVKANVALP